MKGSSGKGRQGVRLRADGEGQLTRGIHLWERSERGEKELAKITLEWGVQRGIWLPQGKGEGGADRDQLAAGQRKTTRSKGSLDRKEVRLTFLGTIWKSSILGSAALQNKTEL